MEFIIEKQWLLILLVFFGFIAYLAWLRARERRWIAKRFGEDKIIAMSFGVEYFGKSSEPGPPRGTRGFLLLLEDRLFFRGRFKQLEVEVPGASIIKIHHGNAHKGVDLHQSVIKIDFIAPEESKDAVAFKVPYPPQWISAMEKAFL